MPKPRRLTLKKFSCVFICVALLIPLISFIPSTVHAESVTYTSPEGIVFRSEAPGWTKSDLITLYKSFITRNRTGKELASLQGIVVAKGNGCGELKDASGCYRSDGVIYLNYGESWTVAETPHTVLSHEYGHHFSNYWLSIYDEKWLRLREIKDYPILYTRAQTTSTQEHTWSLHEIMADDYAALYGEKEQRRTAQIINGDMPRMTDVENELIPHVNELPKLQAYIQELTGLVPDGQIETNVVPQLVSFTPEYRENSWFYRIEFTAATIDPNKNLTYYFTVGRFSDKISHTGTTNIVHYFENSQPVIGSEDIRYHRPAMNPDVVQLIAYDPISMLHTRSKQYLYDFTTLEEPFAIPATKKTMIYRYGQKVRTYDWSNIIGVQVFINNVQVYFSKKPVIINGSTQVPMREVFERLGANVTWNQNNKTATATKNGKTLILEASQVTTIDNFLFVPLRMISEFFDMTVRWDKDTSSVYIK